MHKKKAITAVRIFDGALKSECKMEHHFFITGDALDTEKMRMAL